MKKPLAIIAGLALYTGVALAQTQTVETSAVAPLQSAGSVTTFDPASGAMVVTSPSGPAPVTYTYNTHTTVVDADGNPVGVDVVKSGVPVTVYYTRTGDQMVVSKLVVQRQVTVPVQQQSTTTTTTSSSQ